MIIEMIQGILAGGSAIALLIFSGLTLTCSVVVFLISTPLFVIFSPVLVPATIATTLLATGFTASGSFLSTAISIISWIIKQKTGQDMPKIPGLSPGIVEARDDDKKKKREKKKKKKNDREKKKKNKEEKERKKEGSIMKSKQKKDNMRDKNTDKIKEQRK